MTAQSRCQTRQKMIHCRLILQLKRKIKNNKMKRDSMNITKNPIIYAPVYIPDTPDCEYRFGEKKLSKEKIKYLSKTFSRYGYIDLQHDFTKALLNGKKPIQRGKVIANFITKKEIKLTGLDGVIRTYPEGTWILGIEITDKTAMMLYYQGKLGGVSATAKKRSDADFIHAYVSAKSTQKIPKRILLSDIKDPVVFTVSLVQKPCVHGAKFCNKSCMILNSQKLEDNSMSITEILKEKITSAIEDVDLEKALEESQKSEIEGASEEEVEVTEEEVETEEENPQEEEVEGAEEEVEETPLDAPESQKSYVTREEASSLFKAGFEEMRGTLDTMVENSMNEIVSTLQESQKEDLGYVTTDEVKDIFHEEFDTFQADFEKSLKERQEESIKQFSKTIDTQTTVVETPDPAPSQSKLFADRDANGCKVRGRR